MKEVYYDMSDAEAPRGHRMFKKVNQVNLTLGG